MVKGLERFREHFAAFADRYLIIGGTACDLALTEAGLEFRATKDIDIVLCLETVDAEFGRAFCRSSSAADTNRSRRPRTSESSTASPSPRSMATP